MYLKQQQQQQIIFFSSGSLPLLVNDSVLNKKKEEKQHLDLIYKLAELFKTTYFPYYCFFEFPNILMLFKLQNSFGNNLVFYSHATCTMSGVIPLHNCSSTYHTLLQK